MTEQNSAEDLNKIRHLNVKDITLNKGEETLSPFLQMFQALENLRKDNPASSEIASSTDSVNYKKNTVIFSEHVKPQ